LAFVPAGVRPLLDAGAAPRTRQVPEPEVTSRVTQLWDALSWAAHHHPYELAPSTQEIRGWLAEARLLVAELTPR
jgi:hypothetical protein